jgi:Flp pilus assembly protein TadG
MKKFRLKLAQVRGQAAVEFALIFPLFLAVLVGLAIFSMIFYSYVTLTMAAREGASALVHNPRQTIYNVRLITCNSAFALIRDQVTVKVEPPDNVATAAVSCASLNTSEGAYGSFASQQTPVVSVFYTIPIPSMTIPSATGNLVIFSPITIKAVSVMTIE